MEKEAKVKCAWCAKEAVPKVHKEKSEYGNTVTWTCSFCGQIMASYLDEKKPVLEKVRTFSG